MLSASTPAAIRIHGIRLTNLAMQDALNAIDAALVSHTPIRVAFVNADCINIAARNPQYRQDLAEMDWVFVDGIGMRIAGDLLQQKVRDNVNGTDLFPLLCADLAKRGLRLFMLGAQPGVAQAAANWAIEHYPELQIAGTEHGYIPPEETGALLERIRTSQADVLLVAMGAPLQERWIHQHMTATGATVALAVGGLFDYYSGHIPRAPLWMRRIGLEWLFRLRQEPQRLWRRYLVGNWVFLWRIFTDRLTRSRRQLP